MWIENLKIEKDKIHQLGMQSIHEIEEELKVEKPILLKGMQSVWCLSLNTKQGRGIVNIVKTKSTKNKYIDKQTLIDLIKNQKLTNVNMIEQLKIMKAKRWLKKPYIRFINSDNANQQGSEWQFKENLIMEHSTEGTIIFDILKDGRIGGFELVKEI